MSYMFPGSQKEGGFHGKGKLCQVSDGYVSIPDIDKKVFGMHENRKCALSFQFSLACLSKNNF